MTMITFFVLLFPLMIMAESSDVSDNSSLIPIDENNFPDPIFREYLCHMFDWNPQDNMLSEDEVAGVGIISLSSRDDETYKDIQSLKGIELFPNLHLLPLHLLMNWNQQHDQNYKCFG